MAKKYIPTLEDLELIKSGFVQNVAAYKIAKQIGCNQNVLHRICKEYDIINPKSATIITEEIVELVKKLFAENVPLRKIAEKMDLDVKLIKKVCNDNNLLFSNRGLKGGQRPISIPQEKLCKKNKNKGCGIIKLASQFRIETRTRKSGNTYSRLSVYCLECEKINSSINSKKHYVNNKKYYIGKRKKANARMREREKLDPCLKLRNMVSKSINKALKDSGSGKFGKSVMNYLPYTMEELKTHIESHFKKPGNEWMTWKNRGVYKLGGERKWHIDHIIPQSKLPYDSMEHPNFIKCWGLENIQPLDAVENMQKHDRILKFNSQVMHNQT